MQRLHGHSFFNPPPTSPSNSIFDNPSTSPTNHNNYSILSESEAPILQNMDEERPQRDSSLDTPVLCAGAMTGAIVAAVAAPSPFEIVCAMMGCFGGMITAAICLTCGFIVCRCCSEEQNRPRPGR